MLVLFVEVLGNLVWLKREVKLEGGDEVFYAKVFAVPFLIGRLFFTPVGLLLCSPMIWSAMMILGPN